MTRNRYLTTSLCAAAMLFATSLAFGQKKLQDPFEGGKVDKPPEMILKVYRVADLFTPRPDYPYRPGLPTTDALETKPAANTTGGLGGGSGGGMGGASGGGGQGFFQVPDVPRVAQFGGGGMGGLGGGGGGMGGFSAGMPGSAGPSVDESLRFSRDELRDAIVYTISPDTWEGNGGEGVCNSLGGMFLIKQTAEVHQQIDKLLNEIRTEGGGSHTVTVDAVWLSLTTEDFEKLSPKQNGEGGGLATVDPKLLKDLAAKNPSQQGRVSCYNDQTVHLASGTRRTVVVNAIPTVGFGSVGYTPEIAVPNIGLLLQVRPTVDPDRKSAVLNVTSTMTEWEESDKPITIKTEFQASNKDGINSPGGTTQIPLDRVNLKSQHLGTTVRLPVGQPVLIGGLSQVKNHLDTKPDETSRQLYLIIKLTVNEAAK